MSSIRNEHLQKLMRSLNELFMNQEDDVTRHVAMEASYEDFSTDPHEIAHKSQEDGDGRSAAT